MDGPAVADALLADLRLAFAAPLAAFEAPPVPLQGGYDTDIYSFQVNGVPALSGPLVARIFRPGEGKRAAIEAAIQAGLAAQGFPVPVPLYSSAGDGTLDRGYIVMPLIEGVTLLKAGMLQMPGRLAANHAELHRLDPEPLRAAVASAGDLRRASATLDAKLEEFEALTSAPGMAGLRPGLAWLRANRPARSPDAICHLDFHPLNLLWADGRVRGVVDWGNLAFAPAEADVGCTRILLTVPPAPVPSWLAPGIAVLRRILAWRYTRAYRSRRSVSMRAVRYYEALRCFQALAHLSSRRLSGAGPDGGGYAWSDPATVRRLRSRFRSLTNVPIAPASAP